ncbi:hydrogen peroxide-inducible genes activator [uncultured Shimia sp.]|uniref:hydrogen peroxide-inducible genes activator n=1 Tax=uncultured Shimia sp. TaxID=573152 RepID=UPI00260A4231|nr:hydrogen peroxide-inducible genes activator [uncultured Shimia sp.]
MRPTLRQLQYIIEVADAGRFGQAAERLSVSQPSLSAQIAEAEADLGARIFNRGRHGATLTQAGVDIVRRARRILNEVEDLRASITGDGIFQGRLRLGVLPSIGPYLLPGVVRRLHRDHPDFRLVIREEATDDLEQGLRSGRLDMILSTPEDHPGTLQTPLFRETLWAGVAREDILATSRDPITPTDLTGRSLLTLGPRHRLSGIVVEMAAAANAQVPDEYEGTSLAAIRLMASAGGGVSILPRLYAAAEAQHADDIVLRRVDMPGAVRTISLIQPAAFEPRPGSDILAQALRHEAERIMQTLKTD